MYHSDAIAQLRARPVVTPEPAVKHGSLTLTELAGCLVIATTCVDMWLGIYTLVRCGIYILAVVLAFAGSGFKPRFTTVGALLFLAGGLYILKALLYPPVPLLVRSDIRNIVVGFAFLVTFGIRDLTWEAWRQFQLKAHRTMLIGSAAGAVLGLVKLLYYNQGGIIPRLMDPERGYPLGTSLTMDYNFYSLPLLLGVVSAFWLLKNDQLALWRSIALICLPELVLAVLLSGSRRGFASVLCMVPLLTIWAIYTRQKAALKKRGLGFLAISTASLALVLFGCAAKWDSISEAIRAIGAGDSLGDVFKRWETFQEGTYSESRLYYWSLTLQRLSRFRILEYVFGEGFNYVTDLGADPDLSEDYPHNFLLSSMLYGGIVQTAVLLLLLVTAIKGMLVGQATLIMAWYVMVILFLFTSCNSFFSLEIAIFLTVIGLSIPRRPGVPTGSNIAGLRFSSRG